MSRHARSRWPRIRALGVALVLVGVARKADANPWNILGFDGHSIARGGAMTGAPRDAAAVYYNPAALGGVRTMKAQFTFLHARPFLDVDLQPNPELDALADLPRLDGGAVCAGNETCLDDVERYNAYLDGAAAVHNHHADLRGRLSQRAERPRNLNGVIAGAVIPTTIPVLRLPVAGGIGVFLPPQDLVYGRAKGVSTPFFLDFDDAPHRVVVDLALGIEPVSWLRLGGGVDVLVDVNAAPQAELILPAELEIGSLTAIDPNLGDITVVLDGPIELPWSLAPVVGVQVAPHEDLDLGFAFRDEQSVAVNISGSAVLRSAWGVRELPAELRATGLFQPRQLSMGAAWRPVERLQLFADLRWRQWSRYAPPFAVEVAVEGAGDAACDLVRSFHDLDNALSLAEAVGVEITPDDVCNLIGGLEPGGPGVSANGIDDVRIDFYDASDSSNAFHDTLVPAFGAEVRLGDFLLAGGYRFEASPAPAQTGIHNIFDADTHIVSGGAEFLMRRGASLGVFAQLHRLVRVNAVKDRARVTADSGGSDALPDPEFTTDLAELNALENDPRVTGVQTATPGYPGSSYGGSYLALGVELSIPF